MDESLHPPLSLTICVCCAAKKLIRSQWRRRMTHFGERFFFRRAHEPERWCIGKPNRATSCFAFSGANIFVPRVGGPWNCCTIDWWCGLCNCKPLETSGCHTGELAYFLTLFNSDAYTAINCVLRMGALSVVCFYLFSSLLDAYIILWGYIGQVADNYYYCPTLDVAN